MLSHQKNQFSIIQFWVAVAVAGSAVKKEIRAKRHQTPFHLYTNARCSTPTPVFSDVALELLVISIPPIQLIEMRRPLIDLFNCLSCLTDFGYSVKCDTFVL